MAYKTKSTKRFYVQHNIGRAKYVVNFHDGKKKYDDGSDFFDIEIFKNKKKLAEFQNELRKKGFKESK